jgi:anti-sigma regulatory factor (Ser/Thr protein kinase)
VSHFFKDVVADEKDIILKYYIEAKDFDNAGKASVTMKKNLKRLGIDPKIVQRVAIASYEAEMNLVIYSEGGSIEYAITENEVEIQIIDRGPGIKDVDKAMQPGYTTAEPWVKDLGFGAGMGLPNIKKCVDEMIVKSEVGKGTTLVLKVKV